MSLEFLCELVHFNVFYYFIIIWENFIEPYHINIATAFLIYDLRVE